MTEEGSGGRPLRHHFDRVGHQHPNHQTRRQQPVSKGSSSDEDAYDDSELSSADPTLLRHHVSHRQSRFQDDGEGGESEEEQQRPLDRVIKRTREEQSRYDDDRSTSLSRANDGFRSADRMQQRNRRSASTEVGVRDVGRTKKTPTETDSVGKEDKSVQIDLEGGTAFQSNHQKILSSSSLASQVLERARNRNDKFWSK